ncbi:MAG: GTPase Era [Armatimonadetes bacterium]|nr:GTPase Era [Armatimonadota bacterium]
MKDAGKPAPPSGIFPEVPEGFRSGFAVLWGRPNVGKSTLLNALLGEKIAIVSPKPQTTRNRIAGVLNWENSQVVLWDTPGIHRPKHRLGECLVESARSALPDAEVVLFVVDVSVKPSEEDALCSDHLRGVGCPVMLLLNKVDLCPAEDLDKRWQSYSELLRCDKVAAVSALTGAGLSDLAAVVVDFLPEGPPYFPADMITDQTESFMIGELIREATLHLTHQEIPYSIAVTVEEMTPRSESLLYIAANVVVERDSQKGIVIGNGGKMLRQIGESARSEIERKLDCKVFLDLHVKVREKWRSDEASLQRFGYALSRRDVS